MLRQPRILLHKSQTKNKVPLPHQQCHQLMSRLTTHHRQMFSWIVLRGGAHQFQQTRDKFLDVPVESDVLQRDLRVYSGTSGWVGRRHFFRTLTTGKVTSPNPTGGTRIDSIIFKKGGDVVSKTCATQVNCNRTRMVFETARLAESLLLNVSGLVERYAYLYLRYKNDLCNYLNVLCR
ncbi:hypothetical protein AVEN_219661-1, partial [Araneus ventricosus]